MAGDYTKNRLSGISHCFEKWTWSREGRIFGVPWCPQPRLKGWTSCPLLLNITCQMRQVPADDPLSMIFNYIQVYSCIFINIQLYWLYIDNIQRYSTSIFQKTRHDHALIFTGLKWVGAVSGVGVGMVRNVWVIFGLRGRRGSWKRRKRLETL